MSRDPRLSQTWRHHVELTCPKLAFPRRLGHLRPGRASLTSGQVRYAAESGSQIQGISVAGSRLDQDHQIIRLDEIAHG